MSNLIKFDNNASTTVGTQLLVGETSLVVTTGGGALFSTIASPDIMYLTLDNDTDIEIVQVTTHTAASDTFTIVRAQEGTTAIQWEVGDDVELRLTAGTLDGLVQVDSGGNAKGTNSLNIQPGRADVANVASGTDSITIGRDTEASALNTIALGVSSLSSASYGVSIGDAASVTHQDSVSIGRDAYSGGTDSISVGRSASGGGNNSVAIGGLAVAAGDGVAIGHNSGSNPDSVAIGYNSSCAFSNCVAIGSQSSAGAFFIADSMAIGYNSTAIVANAVAIGKDAIAENSNTTHLVNPLIVRASGATPTANTNELRVRHLSSALVMLTTEQVDLTALGNFEVTLPVDFFVEEIGVIATVVNTLTTQPNISCGTTSGGVDIYASTITTALTAVGERERVTTGLVAGIDQTALNALWFNVATAGSATALDGRFYAKGFFIDI